jgi:hypothetical protein
MGKGLGKLYATGRPYYLSGRNNVRKIRDREQRADIENYSFAIRDIKTVITYQMKF